MKPLAKKPPKGAIIDANKPSAKALLLTQINLVPRHATVPVKSQPLSKGTASIIKKRNHFIMYNEKYILYIDC